MNNHNQTLIIGALLGSFIGAAAVLLSTPYSGAKLRSKILNGLPHEAPKKHHAVKPARKKRAVVKATAKKKVVHHHKH